MNLPRPVSSRRVLLLGVLASIVLHLALIGGLPLSLPVSIPDHLDVTLAPFVTPAPSPPAPVTHPLVPRPAPAARKPSSPVAERTAAPPEAPAPVPTRVPEPADVPSAAQADPANGADPGVSSAPTALPNAQPGPATGVLAAAGPSPGAAPEAAGSALASAPSAPTRLTPPDLPNEGEVDYEVGLGSGEWRLARGTLHWKLDHDHYHIDLVARAVGIARLFKPNPVSQVSEGQITPAGLLPDRFSVVGRAGSDTQEDARFDWSARTLTFLPSGKAQALPDNTQDLLSFFFQFALRPPEDANLGNPVTNGRKLDRYAFELTDRTRLKLPLGEVDTLHISRLHALNEDAFEIWLAQDRHFLPVQMRFYARGRTFTLSATGIRVSGKQGSL